MTFSPQRRGVFRVHILLLRYHLAMSSLPYSLLPFPLLCFLFCYRALNALIVVNNYWVYIGKAEIACAKKKKKKKF